MASRRPRVAVDTCVLLNVLINGANDDPGWLPRSRWVLDEHRRTHEVVLPALVLAELGGAPHVRGNHIESSERKRRVHAVHNWIRENRFVIIDIDERVGIEASLLAPRWQLSGSDAAILAAVKLWEIPTLYTWDSGLLKVGDQIPGVSVVEPQIPTAPARQADFFQQ